MKVLVTGAGGQVGRELVGTAPSGVAFTAASHADLDIGDRAAVAAALEASGAHWIVNAAAYTAVDRAESDREAARAINDTAVGTLAAAAQAAGARLLHL